MGKEAKIGLAVIGVLLSIFGVLLFRHLRVRQPLPTWDHEERLAAEPLVPGQGTDQPSVVTAQEAGAAEGDDSHWNRYAAQAPAESPTDVPNASYMPAEGPPVADRYALRDREQPQAPPATVRASPFQNQPATLKPAEPAVDGEATLDAPAELPRGSAAPVENPLRRLSAELPLDAPADTVEPAIGLELPARTSAAEAEPVEDRYTIGSEPDWADADDAQLPADDPHEASGPPAQMPARERSASPFAEEAPATIEAVDEPAANRYQPQAAAPDDWQTPGGLESRAAMAAPLPVENGMYTAQPNDTLWSISEKVYGTGGYFKAIAAHNRSVLPRSDQLSVGMKVAVPPAEELAEKYPTLCPKPRNSALVQPRTLQATATMPRGAGNVYVVAEGDTLFDIARYELGQASRWAEIYELNRDLLGEDFDYLRPGLELRMPSANRATKASAENRDSRYVR